VVERGELEGPALASSYAKASWLLFPSRYEGFGLPPLEARLTGTRVLVSSAIPSREVLQDDPGTLLFPFEAFDENGEESIRRQACAKIGEIPATAVSLAERKWYGWERAAREYCRAWDGLREESQRAAGGRG
jgi:glycosyltransferase involved in cell wall biosynthesis